MSRWMTRAEWRKLTARMSWNEKRRVWSPPNPPGQLSNTQSRSVSISSCTIRMLDGVSFTSRKLTIDSCSSLRRKLYRQYSHTDGKVTQCNLKFKKPTVVPELTKWDFENRRQKWPWFAWLQRGGQLNCLRQNKPLIDQQIWAWIKERGIWIRPGIEDLEAHFLHQVALMTHPLEKIKY